MERVYNFSPGPGTMPEAVLLKAQHELLNYNGLGLSVMEMSHRSKEFIAIAEKTQSDLRALLNVPENYHVLFLAGGARSQFSMVPLNLLNQKTKAGYVHTGHWSGLAWEEAKRYGDAPLVASGRESDFCDFPDPATWQYDSSMAYVHYCMNETIKGVEYFKDDIDCGVPMVCDMSSNILSRPVDVSKYGLIYACAQKNMGTAGITLVIVRDDLVGHALPFTPGMFDYANQVKNESMYNTPPTYPWYLSGLVLNWVQEQGGLAEMERRAILRSSLLYDAIDSSDFYVNKVAKQARSRMNVSFFTPNADLDDRFQAEAGKLGLWQLKGHKISGGMRASLYNAMPVEGVKALIAFMQDFEKRNG